MNDHFCKIFLIPCSFCASPIFFQDMNRELLTMN